MCRLCTPNGVAARLSLAFFDPSLQRFSAFFPLEQIDILALKGKLTSVTQVEVERQRLIYKGKVLKDDTKLSDYSMQLFPGIDRPAPHEVCFC